MLHGNPTWSFYYRQLVSALKDRYRCIVPDHIGCGLSDKPGDDEYDYHLERRIADVDTLVNHLQLDQPLTLVVHDWGGMIGFGWATTTPDSVSRTVVMNTAAFRIPADKKLPAALWLAGKTPVGSLMVRGLNAFSASAARVAFKKPVNNSVRKAYTGPYDSWDNRIATLRFVQDIPLREGDRGFDIIERTEQGLPLFADKPALIGWGLMDFVFDETFYRDWQTWLPDAELHPYEDCGHYILEDAGQDLIGHIVRFIDQHEPGSNDSR
jgi:haloalkane dehalogenase